VALAGDAVAGVPCIVYFHENQLLYPVRHTAEWDFQFPLTNITSALAAEGPDFEVAVAGQSFRETEGPMAETAGVLGDRLVHLGEPESREAYARLLASADVAVSTADNEFFGLAMLEACYAGATPLVPDRLAYPELYPAECRYGSPEELVARLRAHVADRPAPGAYRGLAEPFTFDALVPRYAEVFEAVARGRDAVS
jgi:glycosyltransferase involved in cell wall biosynthesis